MVRLGEPADACYGKANCLEYTAARRTWAVLFRMGFECGVWRASNYSFNFRRPYDLVFLMRVLSLRTFFRLGRLAIATFDTFFEQNERVCGGRLCVRVSVSSDAPLHNAERLSFLRFA